MNKYTLKTMAIQARRKLLEVIGDGSDRETLACRWFMQLCAVHCLDSLNIHDQTELLAALDPDYSALPQLPQAVYREIRQMLDKHISPKDWQQHVEILGWLYQDYHSEIKEQVFATRLEKKITQQQLPCATQLFTPQWIVSYLAENTLGRLFPDGSEHWKYKLQEVSQTEQVNEKLKMLSNNRPLQQIRCIDPCMGCGHMLITLFDRLFELYTAQGYDGDQAVEQILCHNLYGLDIDPYATLITQFSLRVKAVMKTGHYDLIDPDHFLTIEDTLHQDDKVWQQLIRRDPSLKPIREALRHGGQNGSLTRIFGGNQYQAAIDCPDPSIRNTLLCAWLLSERYDLVLTNPPYLSSAGMNESLLKMVTENYPDSRFDLYACFIERGMEMTAEGGYLAMITQHSWMFIFSYRKLRDRLFRTNLVNMVHLGAKAFDSIKGEVVQTVAFILQNSTIENRKALYCRLVEANNEKGKEELFLSGKNRYSCPVEQFMELPGHPVAYWVPQQVIEAYKTLPPLKQFASPKKGNSTSDNRRFLRYWYEVDPDTLYLNATEIDPEETLVRRWIPYNKGGGYRRWYGCNQFVIDWYDNASAIRKIRTAVVTNEKYFMKPGLTWSTLATGKFSIRWFDEGYIFDNGGCCLFDLKEKRARFCALLNSKVFEYIFAQLNPTLNYQSGQVAVFPTIDQPDEEVDRLAMDCIRLAREDEACFETTRDFTIHPLLKYKCGLEQAVRQFTEECENRFLQLKENEQHLNRIFIDLYGLQDLIDESIPDREITVHRIYPDRKSIADSMKGSAMVLTWRQIVISLISYAVGCILHRFDPRKPGLHDPVSTLIPIDTVSESLMKWIREYFDEESLNWLASVLGGKGSSQEVISHYMKHEFYEDHIRTYMNRPVYWQISSGSLQAYQAVFSIHGYQPAQFRKQLLLQLKNRKKQLQDKDMISEIDHCIEALSSKRAVSLDLNEGVLKNREKMNRLLAPAGI